MKAVQDNLPFQTRLSGRLANICPVATVSLVAGFAAFGADSLPPVPDKPWQPPQLREYERELAHGAFGEKSNGAPIEINPEKVYELPELIDIAERTNPQTRIAWEGA